MNPIHEHKKAYVIGCFTLAMIYALLVGQQSIICRVTDGIVFGIILFPVGYILWYLFRYVIPSKKPSVYQLIVFFTLSILTSVFMVGIEAFVGYLCFPDCFQGFSQTIPVRIFICWLLFILYRLFYISYLTEENTIVSTNELPPLQTELIDRITVRYGNKIKIIPIHEIVFFRADGDYVSIHTAEGRWLKEQTMKYTEDILPPEHFVRTHRSYIVNIHHISRIERYGEQQLVILSNGEKIKISNARYQVLKQRLGL
jgi:hypothetical protein